MKLIFGKDIPLSDGLSAGVRGDFAFQCNVTALPHVINSPLRFDAVFLYSGQVVISPNVCIQSTGLLSEGDVQNSQDMGDNFEEAFNPQDQGGSLVGGSMIGGGWGSLLKSVGKIAMKNAPAVASAAAPLVSDLVEAYKSGKH